MTMPQKFKEPPDPTPAQLLFFLHTLLETIDMLRRGGGAALQYEELGIEAMESLQEMQVMIHDMSVYLKEASILRGFDARGLLDFLAKWMGLFRKHPHPLDALAAFENHFSDAELSEVIRAIDPLAMLLQRELKLQVRAKPKGESRIARKTNRSARAKIFILENKSHQLTVGDVAKAVNCSPPTLYRDKGFMQAWYARQRVTARPPTKGTKKDGRIDADADHDDD